MAGEWVAAGVTAVERVASVGCGWVLVAAGGSTEVAEVCAAERAQVRLRIHFAALMVLLLLAALVGVLT